MRYLVLAALALAFAFTLATARAAGEKPRFVPDKADVRGKVTQKTESPAGQPILGKILIEGVKEADTRHDKASVSITRNTRIEKVANGQRKPARFEDIEKGSRVQADFTAGPTTLSYPVMAGARAVLILE